VKSSRWETSFCWRNFVNCTTINLTIWSHRVTWFVHKCMLRFVFWFKIQSPLGLIIWIYLNQISSVNYRYRNIISTHTNGYVMLGLCMKPCATSSHCFTTLWIWKIHNTFIGNALWGEVISEVTTSHYWVKVILLNCHLWLTPYECMNTLPRPCGLDPDKVYDNFRSICR